jgi:HAMP domain-containing protein
MKYRYYAMRHGQSEANHQGILMSDMVHAVERYGLTAKGIEQAKKAGENLSISKEHLVIISSPMKRARETAEIVAEKTGEESADQSTVTAMKPSRSKALAGNARIIALVMIGAALLLIGIIVFVYANRLTGKIESLTDVADRISAGDLEIKIEMKSRDEIGELAQAIARMRDKIRLYIEKLQQHP